MSFNVWKCIFFILAFSGLIVLLRNFTYGESWKYRILSNLQNQIQSSNLSGNLQMFYYNSPFCQHLGQSLSPVEELENQDLFNSVDWPHSKFGSRPHNLSQTSDPAHSFFTIVPSKKDKSWYVGDQLEVLVHMHDFEGQPKRYGGDLLLTRLHSPKYRAGVAGQVLDHKNGLYSAYFSLLWEGSAQVEVMMVHSSEAVAVLDQLTDKKPDRAIFVSLFRRDLNTSETTVCNICLPQHQGPLCNYTDLHSGEPWYCYKPKMLGCDTRINHAKGGYLKNVITTEEALLFQSDVNIKVHIHSSSMNTINVLPSRKENSNEKLDHVKLATSGYYYQDLWRPLLGGITMRQFDKVSSSRCLSNKLVYMYGDSTMRQWYEYLVRLVPEMKEFNLHTPAKAGPLMAVESNNNIMMHYRSHGPPILYTPVAVSELHYIANELDGLSGGPNTVVAISIWAHFTTFPMEVYIRRLRNIRKAVVRLLDRAPGTLVVVRTPNPRELGQDKSLYHSDWFSLHQNVVLRSMFKDINVLLVDAWQMCVAHHEPHNIHPPKAIVKNMVNMMLSYICRDGTRKN
ncbi:NXPE family member 3-like isoform X1 [Corythoichthys intestinalis]|uniref:NXPE family member 3-like isoform X1 n=1 Tax=Corythoichthys intestinalis TaxID=161448 RepID=UPI0025A628E7|nr:NXPE family member 3-like isoform X1 [Corythoichthys intestinalis]